ncbi:hypothetical protein VCHA53O466_50129 [Vibrio chagasii]|nr:hypothetical protein VCHA53O466_50129 [Vibrio chagasii]
MRGMISLSFKSKGTERLGHQTRLLGVCAEDLPTTLTKIGLEITCVDGGILIDESHLDYHRILLPQSFLRKVSSDYLFDGYAELVGGSELKLLLDNCITMMNRSTFGTDKYYAELVSSFIKGYRQFGCEEIVIDRSAHNHPSPPKTMRFLRGVKSAFGQSVGLVGIDADGISTLRLGSGNFSLILDFDASCDELVHSFAADYKCEATVLTRQSSASGNYSVCFSSSSEESLLSLLDSYGANENIRVHNQMICALVDATF